jgi:energy-coupling factor transport system permease protein
VNHLHPLSLILLGLAGLVAVSSRDGIGLFLGCLCLVTGALLAANFHLLILIRRSRWLLLTMLLMFGWGTPGTPLSSIPGATQEGLLLAAQSIARLMTALSTVALILKALSPPELVAGMRSLLAPLALVKVSRDRVAVRLALTLNEVETSRRGDNSQLERIETTLTLPESVFGAADCALGALAVALVIGVWLG